MNYTTQPATVLNTVQPAVIINQAQIPKPSELIFPNRWNTGLCECCTDCGACAFAFFCPLCFYCQFDKNAKECFCTTFFTTVITLFPLSLCLYRPKLRGAYKIDGSLIEDCCLSFWCCFCVLLQMHNELRYHGDIMN